MKLPIFIEKFVEARFSQAYRADIVEEFIRHAASGGGNKYTQRTVRNLIKAYTRGIDPTTLNHYGE